MIELLEQCVSIPSLSGQEQHVAEFLRDEMLKRGFDRAYIDDAGNAVGIVGSGSRQIVFLGHMDTVGGDVPVRYDDDKLYGRGTVDAKGPLCAFVLAGQKIADARCKTQDQSSSVLRLASDFQLIVIGTVEEEAATSKGARFAATQYAPEFCIVGEPSGMDGITLGYKGRLLADVYVGRAMQHTAGPGASASETAVDFWAWAKSFVEYYNIGKEKVFDQIQLSLRSIQSGDDGLSEWCNMTIGLRLPLEFDPAMAKEVFGKAFTDVASHTVTGRASISFRGEESAYRSSKESPLARAFVDAIRAEKMRPAFKLKTGTADFNVVGPVWNCPIVAYGPGDSALDHTPNEHVSIDEFEKAVKVLTHVLQSLMKS